MCMCGCNEQLQTKLCEWFIFGQRFTFRFKIQTWRVVGKTNQNMVSIPKNDTVAKQLQRGLLVCNACYEFTTANFHFVIMDFFMSFHFEKYIPDDRSKRQM